MIYTNEAAIIRGFINNILKERWRSKIDNPYVILYIQDVTTNIDWYITSYDKDNDLMTGVAGLDDKRAIMKQFLLNSLDGHNLFYRTYSKSNCYKIIDLYPNIKITTI